MTAHDSSLFRDEALNERRQRLEGEVILTQPVRTRMIVLLLVTIIAVVSGWVVLGTYTRTEVARGLLVTDVPTAKIMAPRPGRVKEIFVRDGDYVRPGQKLAAIMVEELTDRGGSVSAQSVGALDKQRALAAQQAVLASKRAFQERARLTASFNGLQKQGADVEVQLRLQRELVASAKETLERMTPAMDRGFISRIEFEARRQAWLTAQEQLAQLSQQSNSLFQQETEVRSQLDRVSTDAATEIATAQASVAAFEGQRAQALAQRGYVITAVTDGRVTALQAAVGRSVDAAVPLMQIVPDGTALHAEVYAPSRAIGFVKAGQEVRLLYDAFSYQRFGSFGGHVIRVSRTVLDPHEISAPVKVEEPVYRIDVLLDRQSVAAFGGSLPLEPGMTLSANLVLDRRSFSDWLLEPLNAVARRVR